MKTKNIKFITIFLVLLFCLVGAVSATENATTHTSNVANDQTVTTETVHEDLSESMETETLKDNSDSVTKTKTKKETTTAVNSQNNITTSNKEIKTLTENIKEPTEYVDFYVSDNDGNDTNNGSQSSPFKTIKTAINKTTSDKIYNIYILEGIYKGEGNTNITVNGTYFINFIGSGTDKTIIDGELDYTINYNSWVWSGSSDEWRPWLSNATGNWFMKITAGNGLFKVTNFRIQNCYSPSGSSITACYNATIDNYANLNATNMYFYHNAAGCGAGIRNGYLNHNPQATLYVDNCTFDSNLKATTTGNFGAAVYNNATAIINNSVVINNYARWGSVTTDKTMYVYNTYFANNKGYDGSSGYKNGPTIYANTGNADYYNAYDSEGLLLHVENCTFENNQHVDITYGKASSVIINNIFNNSCGIYLTAGTKEGYSQVIANNQFINMQPSALATSMTSTTKPSWGIYSLSSIPLIIENNTIDVKDTTYGYGLYLTANTIVKNNTLNNYIYINGKNNTIINNTIKTTKENTILLTKSAKEVTISNNTLLGGYANGDLSINNILTDTVLENNIPKASTYTINDENYATYFNPEGILRNDVVDNGSKLIFTGNLTNKNFIFDNIKVAIDSNTTLINATIVTQNNATVLFNNLKIDNTKNDKGYVILLNSEGNTINNANIHLVSNKPSQIIRIEADNNIITGTNANNPTMINAIIPASDVEWNDDYSIGIAKSLGILIQSSNNLLSFVELHITSLNPETTSSNPTLEGIDIQSKAVGEYVTGNQIKSNKIYVDGGSYVYGLNIARAKNTVTPLSWFYVTSDNYGAGIQIGDSDYNNISGYIEVTANNSAYGFYSTAMSNGITNNTNLAKLYLQKINATNAIGISLEGAKNTELSSATYTLYGKTVIAIEITEDYKGNVPENTIINGLTINLNGLNDTSSIMTINNALNTTITGSTIKLTKGQGIILTDTINSTVTNNYINIGDLLGGNFAIKNNTESKIADNTPTIAVLTDETYDNFFDENNTLCIDAPIITINGDLHNKVLIFANITNSIDIKNKANYTLYNTTIILAGNSSKSTGSTVILNIDGLNFENVNKPVFKDEIYGTIQKNVYFKNTNIKVIGDNIIAFDAYNNQSYVYLAITESNITMDGQNVVVVNYSGYNRGQPVDVTNNNIYVKTTENAIVLNADSASVELNENYIKMNAKNAVTSNLNDSRISYFEENNIEITADNARVINMVKGGTYSSYISENTINIKSSNPTIVMNITGGSRVYIDENYIVVDALNGETPVIYLDSKSSDVEDNYILAKDVCGNNAVADTGISISGNTPESAHINVEHEPWIVFKENTLSFNITNDNNETITGNLKAIINGEEIP